jgi:hypothetical protein
MSQHEWKQGDVFRRTRAGSVPALALHTAHKVVEVDWDVLLVRCAQGYNHAMESIELVVPSEPSEPSETLKIVKIALGKRGPDNGSYDRMQVYEQPY